MVQICRVATKKLYPDTKMPLDGGDGNSGHDVYAHNFKMIFRSDGYREICEKAPEGSRMIPGCCVATKEDESEGYLTLNPGERALVGVGIATKIPRSTEIQVRARSGYSLKKGLRPHNSPGTVDADYRGEIGVILINDSNQAQKIEIGDRIAQLVICPVYIGQYYEVDDLDETERGKGGYGSSGS